MMKDEIHVKERMTSFIMTPSEKRALRILAAEAGVSVSDYIRTILFNHTALIEKAREVEDRLHLNSKS